MNGSGGNSGKASIELSLIPEPQWGMNYFNKLPGFIRSPAGLEWILLKKLPLIYLICSIIPATVILLIYLINHTINPVQLQTIYLCIGILFSVFFFVGATAIGCIVVLLMKGPAYVADPYELPKENKALERYPEK